MDVRKISLVQHSFWSFHDENYSEAMLPKVHLPHNLCSFFSIARDSSVTEASL
jgi:hypothetical protein